MNSSREDDTPVAVEPEQNADSIDTVQVLWEHQQAGPSTGESRPPDDHPPALNDDAPAKPTAADPDEWVRILWENQGRALEARLAESNRELEALRLKMAADRAAQDARYAELGFTPEEIADMNERFERSIAERHAELDKLDAMFAASGATDEERADSYAALDAYENELHTRSAAGLPVLQPNESPTWRRHVRRLIYRYPRQMLGRRYDRLLAESRAAVRDVDVAVADEHADEAAANAVANAHTCWRTSAPPPPYCPPTSFCGSGTSGAARLRVEHACEVRQ